MKWAEAAVWIVLILASFGGCVVCNHYAKESAVPLISCTGRK